MEPYYLTDGSGGAAIKAHIEPHHFWRPRGTNTATILTNTEEEHELYEDRIRFDLEVIAL